MYFFREYRVILVDKVSGGMIKFIFDLFYKKLNFNIFKKVLS